MITKTGSLDKTIVNIIEKSFGRNKTSEKILDNIRNSHFAGNQENAARFANVLSKYSVIPSAALEMSYCMTYDNTYSDFDTKCLDIFVDLIGSDRFISILNQFRTINDKCLKIMAVSMSFGAKSVAESNSRESFNRFIEIADAKIVISTLAGFAHSEAIEGASSLVVTALESGEMHLVDRICKLVKDMEDSPAALNFLGESMNLDGFVSAVGRDLKIERTLRS